MHTQISSKLAALAVALLMNSLLIVAVSQLFSSHLVQRATPVTIARGVYGAGEKINAIGSVS